MRSSRAALLGFGACVQACFMRNYEALREAGTDASAGADGGLVADAGPNLDAGGALDAGTIRDADVDAWLHDPLDAACAADASEPVRACDSSLCPPVLPTGFACSAACVLPTCLPCWACRGFCDDTTEGVCATNCQPDRICIHKCLHTTCESICAERAKCDVDCTQADSCDITCEEGSTCNVYCPDGERCSVACKPGARCTLICGTPGVACNFSECAGPVARCGGQTFCGAGLGCPPP